MFLKKHYEIPFLKECALLFFLLHRILTERDNAIQGYTVLFPLHYLVKTATGYIASQVNAFAQFEVPFTCDYSICRI